MDMDLKNKDFILITENGMMAHGFKKHDVLTMLLISFVETFSNTVAEIDVKQGVDKILDVLKDMVAEEKEEDHDDDDDEDNELYEMISKLFKD